MRKILIGLFATLALVACGNDSADEIPHPPKQIEVYIYRGHSLYCVQIEESDYGGDRSCDFDRFYNENPELLTSLPTTSFS